MFSTSPEAAIFPFAFELSATPPAMHTFRLFVFSMANFTTLIIAISHMSCTAYATILVRVLDFALRDSPRPEQPDHFCKRGCAVRNQFSRMHFVWPSFRLNECAQIHAGLAVRRQPHHFPFVAVAVKTQIFCEFAVEISERIRKRNCQDVLSSPACPHQIDVASHAPRPSITTTAASSNPE